MKKNTIILEQPDNSGQWKKVPPPLKGKIDTNKNDVSSDGNWYKPKGNGSTPPKETITNTEILDKIKTGGKDFWDKIKTGVPSIIGSAGKYFYDKSQDLEKWWEKYKKEHSGGSIDNGGQTPSGRFRDDPDNHLQHPRPIHWRTATLVLVYLHRLEPTQADFHHAEQTWCQTQRPCDKYRVSSDYSL